MSSKRNVRRKACKGKRRHPHFAAAKHAISLLVQSGRTGGAFMHPYQCPFCGGVHVGHARHRRRTRRAQFAS